MKLIGWIVVLGLLAGGGYWWMKRGKVASGKIEYRTATVTKGDITQIYAERDAALGRRVAAEIG